MNGETDPHDKHAKKSEYSHAVGEEEEGEEGYYESIERSFHPF